MITVTLNAWELFMFRCALYASFTSFAIVIVAYGLRFLMGLWKFATKPRRRYYR